MKVMLLAVEAKPGPEIIIDASEPAQVYCQILGVTAHSHAEMIEIVKKYLNQDCGSTLIDVYQTWVPDFAGRERDIQECCGDTGKVGVWYESGKMWVAEEEDRTTKADLLSELI